MLQHYQMNIAAIHVKTYWHVMPNASRFNLFSSTLNYIKDTQWLNCLPVMSHLLLIPLEYHSHAIMRKDKKCRPMAYGNILNNKAKQITIMHPQLS